MIRKLQLIALLILLAFSFRVAAQQRPSADVILTNAKIWTVDPERPTAEAVAIIGDRIVAVGSAAEIDRWRGSATRIIDGGGKLVLPGFNDAHVHFSDGGQQLDSVDLKDSPSQEEFKKRIAERAQHYPREWMTGGEWDDQRWTPAKLPTRQLIDSVSPDTPVFVYRYDGHMALANSVALKIAGVTKATKAPPGGEIVRDANGEPTGILKDAAMDLVASKIPPLSRAALTRVMRRAMAHAARLGVTSVQDMAVPYDDISILSDLAEKNELSTRIYVAPLIANWQDQAKIGIRHAFGTPYLRMGALKGFADGSLGSTTAYFFQPYTDDPKTRGLLADDMIPLSKMRDRLIGLDAAGLQACVHAIGDEAISDVLDLYQDVVNKNGPKDRRFRIEHAQHMAPKDFERFRRLDVIASVQPYHAIDDGRWAEKRIGPERAKTTYAFRTFLNNKVRLAFGTDWPVAPLNPLLTIYAAVTRETLDGKNPDGWYPEQKLKVSEAVEAYTMGSAYAEFQDKDKGSITPGKQADMIVLSDDIFAIKPDAIKDVTVEMTMVGGKVVYPMKEQ